MQKIRREGRGIHELAKPECLTELYADVNPEARMSSKYQNYMPFAPSNYEASQLDG